ncbi:MAG: tRNA pseudouridine(38-40) synthase TruA [Hydrogenoanaerobacterium sp.]
MRNIKLIISYLGTNYHGFQVQKNGVTVCEALQDAMEQVLRERDDVKGCSRTDAGVHANAYCLSFKTESKMPVRRIKMGLNAVLPCDISVLSAEEAAEDFHARYSCKGKRYIYKLWNSEARNPFLQGLAFQYFRPIDLVKAQSVCSVLTGTHDFAAFCGGKNTKEDTTRTIYSFDIKKNGELVELAVEGDGFLYNMVRILAGTVIAVNEDRLAIEDVSKMLDEKCRRMQCRTMPACGLYLDRVFY